MLSVENQIYKRIKNHKHGKIFFPADFKESGASANVRKALNGLVEKDVLIRIAHGIYLYPKKHKLLGVLMPTIEEVALAISKRDKARIIPTGAQALNKLGLSTQVPLNTVYLTDGAPRGVKIGNGIIKFKKASPKVLAFKSEVVLLVVLGLRELGEAKVSPSDIDRISLVLSEVDSQLLKHDLKLAPEWIAEIIQNIEVK